MLATPAELPRRSAAAGAFATSAIDPALLHDIRVLVVDDEEDTRLLLETTLAQYGADVTTAGSAAAALSAIDHRCPDVLLSDIGMPHEDGYSLIRRVRALPSGRGGAIPAVAITAYASALDRSAVLAAGYQAHVAKPFDAGTLASLVAELGRAARAH